MSTHVQFIARQAILNREQAAVGYELLYRGGPEQAALFDDPDIASKKTLDTSLLFGLDVLCGETKAYINCSRDLLIGDYLYGLPSSRVVVELPITLAEDTQIREACKRLKTRGYCLAVDNFVPEHSLAGLLPMVEILKINFNTPSRGQREEMVGQYGGHFLLVAQKVETREDFKAAVDAGYDLFQGYFFSRPELLSIRDMNVSQQAYMKLLEAAHDPEMDFLSLEHIIKSDAALCYRLLRYMNSALFCTQSGVSSIRHALILLGEREIRRWILLATVALAGDARPDELIRVAMSRAMFAELMACHARVQPYHAFLLGLFSLMDAILNVPLPTIVQRVEIPAEVAAALSGKAGRLRRLLTMIEAYEKAEWPVCEKIAEELGLQERTLPESYREALAWVDRVMA